MKYYLDANALIDILNGNKAVLARAAEITMSENTLGIPDIAYYEVVRGFEYKPDTKKQADFLKENECFMAQGFLFDKALEHDEFEKRLINRKYEI